MPSILSSRYGKTRVRLTYVDRTRRPHEVRELSVSIFFTGDFDPAYRAGDNSSVLPTDTMKNTVYFLARQLAWNSIEEFAAALSKHFLATVPSLKRVAIEVEQLPWQAIGSHTAAFFQAGTERRTTRLEASHESITVRSGLKSLQILKTADSAFSGFLHDELTTLPETEDRLFGTVLEADWLYTRHDIAFNDSHHAIRTLLLDCFARHHSLSVQHTLFAMGDAVLKNVNNVEEIHLVMPNKHCLLVDLTRFGRDNPNQVFQPIDEPSGFIEATVGR